jgi:hypothetical protein
MFDMEQGAPIRPALNLRQISPAVAVMLPYFQERIEGRASVWLFVLFGPAARSGTTLQFVFTL